MKCKHNRHKACLTQVDHVEAASERAHAGTACFLSYLHMAQKASWMLPRWSGRGLVVVIKWGGGGCGCLVDYSPKTCPVPRIPLRNSRKSCIETTP